MINKTWFKKSLVVEFTRWLFQQRHQLCPVVLDHAQDQQLARSDPSRRNIGSKSLTRNEKDDRTCGLASCTRNNSRLSSITHNFFSKPVNEPFPSYFGQLCKIPKYIYNIMKERVSRSCFINSNVATSYSLFQSLHSLDELVSSTMTTVHKWTSLWVTRVEKVERRACRTIHLGRGQWANQRLCIAFKLLFQFTMQHSYSFLSHIEKLLHSRFRLWERMRKRMGVLLVSWIQSTETAPI